VGHEWAQAEREHEGRHLGLQSMVSSFPSYQKR
jgi:hypothetical protein